MPEVTSDTEPGLDAGERRGIGIADADTGGPLSGPTRMKMLDWLVGYRKDWLRPDIMAGLITAAVVIPKAMAYATVAGLPVQAGLYTAFLPMLIYAVLGSSRVLSVSTTTTIAILTGAALAVVVPNGDPALLLRAAASLTLMVGGLLVVASILRVGFLANFISEPVLSGFKAGIGVVIVLDQVPKLLGVHFPKGSFLENLLALFQSLPGTSAATLAVSLVMMALLLGLKRFVPRLPAPLVTVAAGIAATSLLGLGAYGVETVGEIQRGLPALTLPDFSLFSQLWPGAIGIALMSFTETMAAGRAFAQSGEPALRPNQELLATGIATAGGAILGGMPAGGGTSQTAVNRLAGARSQLAGLVTSGATLLTLLFLAPLISQMPQATLAAIVIVYSVGLIQLPEFRAILAVRRTEFIWAIAAFAGVMLLGTLKGILVAIIISLVSLAHQVSDPPVYRLGRKRGASVFRPVSEEHPDDEIFDGLLILRPVGRLFFANGQRVAEKFRGLIEQTQPRVVVLDLSAVFDVEYTVLKMLAEGEARMRERGISFWLVGLTPEVLAAVRRSPFGQAVGQERMFFTLDDAVARHLAPTRGYRSEAGSSELGPGERRCSCHSGWQQVQRHGEDRIDHQQQDAHEPRRAPAVGHHRGGHRGDEHHHHGTRPELQVHRRRPDQIAHEHKHRRDEERDLGRAAQRDAHAQVQPVLARSRKRRGHFRRRADQRHDDEPHERRRHPQRLRRLLHRLDKNLAHQRHQHRDAGQRREGQTHRPRRVAGLAGFRAGEQFGVRLQRKEHAQPVRDDEQDRQTHAQLLGERGPRY